MRLLGLFGRNRYFNYPVCKTRRAFCEDTPQKGSSHEVGKLFEERSFHILKNFKGIKEINLTGKTGDQGIDMEGVWQNPVTQDDIKVFVQCKCENKYGSSRYVREMIGSTIARMEREGRTNDKSLAILIHNLNWTSVALKCIGESKHPVVLAICPTVADNDQQKNAAIPHSLHLSSFKMNNAARKLLKGLIVARKSNFDRKNYEVSLVWESELC